MSSEININAADLATNLGNSTLSSVTPKIQEGVAQQYTYQHSNPRVTTPYYEIEDIYEGVRIPFEGFTFKNRHCFDFNLIRTVKGLSNENLIYDFKDETIDISTLPGVQYFNTNIGTKDIAFTLSFDKIDDEQLAQIKEWLRPDSVGELCLDEFIYKKFKAKVKSAPKFQFVPFDNEKTSLVTGLNQRFYKGQIDVTFLLLSPLGECRENFMYQDYLFDGESQVVEFLVGDIDLTGKVNTNDVQQLLSYGNDSFDTAVTYGVLSEILSEIQEILLNSNWDFYQENGQGLRPTLNDELLTEVAQIVLKGILFGEEYETPGTIHEATNNILSIAAGIKPFEKFTLVINSNDNTELIFDSDEKYITVKENQEEGYTPLIIAPLHDENSQAFLKLGTFMVGDANFDGKINTGEFPIMIRASASNINWSNIVKGSFVLKALMTNGTNVIRFGGTSTDSNSFEQLTDGDKRNLVRVIVTAICDYNANGHIQQGATDLLKRVAGTNELFNIKNKYINTNPSTAIIRFDTRFAFGVHKTGAGFKVIVAYDEPIFVYQSIYKRYSGTWKYVIYTVNNEGTISRDPETSEEILGIQKFDALQLNEEGKIKGYGKNNPPSSIDFQNEKVYINNSTNESLSSYTEINETYYRDLEGGLRGEFLVGDVDLNGEVNTSDAHLVLKYKDETAEGAMNDIIQDEHPNPILSNLCFVKPDGNDYALVEDDQAINAIKTKLIEGLYRRQATSFDNNLLSKGILDIFAGIKQRIYCYYLYGDDDIEYLYYSTNKRDINDEIDINVNGTVVNATIRNIYTSGHIRLNEDFNTFDATVAENIVENITLNQMNDWLMGYSGAENVGNLPEDWFKFYIGNGSGTKPETRALKKEIIAFVFMLKQVKQADLNKISDNTGIDELFDVPIVPFNLATYTLKVSSGQEEALPFKIFDDNGTYTIKQPNDSGYNSTNNLIYLVTCANQVKEVTGTIWSGSLLNNNTPSNSEWYDSLIGGEHQVAINEEVFYFPQLNQLSTSFKFKPHRDYGEGYSASNLPQLDIKLCPQLIDFDFSTGQQYPTWDANNIENNLMPFSLVFKKFIHPRNENGLTNYLECYVNNYGHLPCEPTISFNLKPSTELGNDSNFIDYSEILSNKTPVLTIALYGQKVVTDLKTNKESFVDNLKCIGAVKFELPEYTQDEALYNLGTKIIIDFQKKGFYYNVGGQKYDISKYQIAGDYFQIPQSIQYDNDKKIEYKNMSIRILGDLVSINYTRDCIEVLYIERIITDTQENNFNHILDERNRPLIYGDAAKIEYSTLYL